MQIILFLDYDMPMMNGLEVIAEIKAYHLLSNEKWLLTSKLIHGIEIGLPSNFKPIKKPIFVIFSAFQHPSFQ